MDFQPNERRLSGYTESTPQQAGPCSGESWWHGCTELHGALTSPPEQAPGSLLVASQLLMWAMASQKQVQQQGTRRDQKVPTGVQLGGSIGPSKWLSPATPCPGACRGCRVIPSFQAMGTLTGLGRKLVPSSLLMRGRDIEHSPTQMWEEA